MSSLAVLGSALALAGCAAPQHAANPQQLDPVRRIVTSEDPAGRAFVLADGASGNVVTLNGSRIERLWETGAAPIAIPVTRDLGAQAGNAYRPGFTGSSLYVADIPPGSDLKDIPLHKQESMDYIVLLAGQIDLVIDGGKRIAMKTGDVLVQAGNNHSWINTGTGTARLLCVTQTGIRGPVAP
jgi:mannose-6-phosphate isomerase-like protein (cupin superfamily)